MCGRYTRSYTWEQVRDFLDLRFPEQMELGASYNVAPTQTAPIVRAATGGRELAMARWGLVPGWAKDLSIGNRMINARSETVAEKPAYRSAFRHRRCVVPVSGFYEWRRMPDGSKRPQYFQRADGEMMCLAGLWERWTRTGGAVESFTVIVTGANEMMRPIHDRMPVVLEPEAVERWLDPEASVEAALALLGPAAEGVLGVHEVSSRVNNPRNDDPSLVAPVEPDGGFWGE